MQFFVQGLFRKRVTQESLCYTGKTPTKIRAMSFALPPDFLEIDPSAHPANLARKALVLDRSTSFWREAFLSHPASLSMNCFVSGGEEPGEITAADTFLSEALSSRPVPAREAQRFFHAMAPHGMQRLVRLGSRLVAIPTLSRVVTDGTEHRHQFWLPAEAVQCLQSLILGVDLDAGLPATVPAGPRIRF